MKKVSRSRVFGWTALGLLGAALAQSCGASGDPQRSGDRGGTGGQVGSDASDDAIIERPDPGGAGGESPYNPLCGVVGCVPDRPDSCAPTTGGGPGDAGPGTGGTMGDGGRGMGGAIDGGRSSGGAPSDGGVGGEGGQGASANAGGRAGTAGRGGTSGAGPIVNSCQVRLKEGDPRAQCVPAGPGLADAPCLSGGDCAPGLACVAEGEAGQCRPYCCEPGSCPDRTHCFERSLFGVAPVLEVPVCVPAVDCGLTEPYPCPDGGTCSCPAGLACMVVGTEGTTTCVEPGRGRYNPQTGVGQDCPCAWGHVCSQVTNSCVKLCQTTVPETCVGTGMCQVSAELPSGWGVCVGVPRPDAG